MVHARRGERAAYRPIETPLSPSADPLEVAAGLLALARFRTLYIADLDAIRGTGDNGAAVAALRARFPVLDVWVDAGGRSGQGTADVVGTEMFADLATARAALSGAAILSLDHDANGPLGPLHDEPELWPERVIVMTLARVGAGQGPDLNRLAQVLDKAGGRRVYAAGGVSAPADLDRLEAMGVAGVLLASALHDGRIGAETLARFVPAP